MRKHLLALLSVIFALSMAACTPTNAPSVQDTSPSTPPSTSPTITEDTPLHTFYALSVPVETENTTHDDGTVLFEYEYPHIQVHIGDQAVADKITVDFLTRVDNTRENANAIAQQASADYTPGTNWSPYKYHIYYSPTRVDQGIISLFGTRTTFTGGLHPDENCTSVTYDAATGEFLTMGSILNHIDSKQQLCELVIDELDKVAYQYSLFDGYADVVKDRFTRDESTDEAFYFTNSGLCLYFAPYEMAPFASGIIIVEIPYSKLPGILNDAYFPDEYFPSTGSLTVQNVAQDSAPQFKQLIETVLHPNGDKVLFYSDKTVRNIKITHGIWTPDGLYFQPDYIIFSATGVSNEKAIVIQLGVPEILPDLMVSYDTAVGTHRFYISRNSANSISLLPAE